MCSGTHTKEAGSTSLDRANVFTGTDDPSFAGTQAIIKVLGHQYQ